MRGRWFLAAGRRLIVRRRAERFSRMTNSPVVPRVSRTLRALRSVTARTLFNWVDARAPPMLPVRTREEPICLPMLVVAPAISFSAGLLGHRARRLIGLLAHAVDGGGTWVAAVACSAMPRVTDAIILVSPSVALAT